MINYLGFWGDMYYGRAEDKTLQNKHKSILLEITIN